MKQKLIIAATVGVIAMLTVLYGAGTTVNGTRIINGDLTVKGTCTGCGTSSPLALVNTFANIAATTCNGSNDKQVGYPTGSPLIGICTSSAWSWIYPSLGPITLPILGNFTSTNGTGSATDATSGALWIESSAPGSGVESYQLWTMAQPTRPYTITACFEFDSQYDDFEQFGIIFADTTPTKFVGYEVGFGSANVANTLMTRVTKYDSTSAANSNYNVGFSGSLGSPICLAAKDDNTNFSFYRGVRVNPFDSTKWVLYGTTHSRTDFLTPARVGFMISGGASKAHARLIHLTIQ